MNESKVLGKFARLYVSKITKFGVMLRSFEEKEKAQIPIISMTANAFSEDKQNALASGMNGHIAKPLRISTLFSTLDRILTSDRT